MSNWISEQADVATLAAQADDAISEVEKMAKRGYVNNGLLKGVNASYLFTDGGVLKFFDASTKTVKTVTLT
jgi:hypothetical protein